MIIAVQGSKGFDDYELFMRAMGVALSNIVTGTVDVWSVGPYKINSFTAAFCNSAENYLKAKGIKIKFQKVTPSFVMSNIEAVDYLAYLATPREPKGTALTAAAELASIETGIFRY